MEGVGKCQLKYVVDHAPEVRLAEVDVEHAGGNGLVSGELLDYRRRLTGLGESGAKSVAKRVEGDRPVYPRDVPILPKGARQVVAERLGVSSAAFSLRTAKNKSACWMALRLGEHTDRGPG
jgi:hypothetical protein